MKQIWKVDLLYFRCILFVACFSNFATSVDDTRFNVIGKHILCAHSKDQLVESSLCNVKLLNRTSNLYNASLVLHPNITLHNAYVSFFITKIKYFIFWENYVLRLNSPLITDFELSIVQSLWNFKSICVPEFKQPEIILSQCHRMVVRLRLKLSIVCAQQLFL